MEIYRCLTEAELARKVAQLIVDEIKQNPGLLMCIATGSSPTASYQEIVKRNDEFSSEQIRIVKLDEWWRVPMQNPGTCESYLRKHILEPLKISDDRFLGFDSDAENPEVEIQRIQSYLEKNGPVDICFLGIGMNGHIALNEPNEFLLPNCHVADLSVRSLEHSMVSAMHPRPTKGLTLGMADILQSKMIIMIISGKHKTHITKEFLSGKITTNIPASMLWLHRNTKCFICE